MSTLLKEQQKKKSDDTIRLVKNQLLPTINDEIQMVT